MTETGDVVSNSFTTTNNQDGFQTLHTVLNSLDVQEEIRIGFYHTYSLKSLTRLRDTLVKQKSFYIVKITNVLYHTFPEFKPFFWKPLKQNRFIPT